MRWDDPLSVLQGPEKEAYRRQQGIIQKVQGVATIPSRPRNVLATSQSGSVLLTWSAPQSTQGATGYRVYKDTENNLLQEFPNLSTNSYTVTLPSGTTVNLFVSTFGLGGESRKVQVICKAT
jgi:hypothetical protein